MPEEITQKLGFEASQAIQTLNTLKTSLDGFRNSLSSSGKAARQFNTESKPLVTSLKQLKNEATAASRSLRSLGTLRGPSQLASSTRAASDSLRVLNQNSLQAVGASQHLAGSFYSMQTSSQRLGTSLTNVTTTLGPGLQRAGTQAATSVSKVSTAAKTASKQFQTFGNTGKKSINDITLSWKTMARIIQAQLIIRAFSSIIQGFKDAANSAIEFQLAMAEVSTISGVALGNLDQMSTAVMQLSNELGKGLTDVAEGLYQTISNQVVEATEAINFLREAEKLAIVTHAETKDAVNAVSSVMNSYGMAASEAAHTSDVLFKTVELGRLRLNEIGDILGRVTPLTSEMGVSFEETAAAIATMTRQGVKANTAVTQLRAIMLKMIKPTEAMQKVFKEWGVKDAATAIKRFGGLTGVLKKLSEEVNGDTAEFAKFLNRVRSVAGALGVLNNDGKTMAETLEQIENATGAASEAWNKYSKVDAHQITKNINELKNNFIQLGKEALPLLKDITSFLTNVVQNSGDAKAALAGLAGAIAGLVAASAAAFPALIGYLTAAVPMIAAATIGFVALYKAVQKYQAWKDLKTTADDTLRSIEQNEKDLADTLKRLRESRTEHDKQEWKKQEQAAYTYFAVLNQAWNKNSQIIKTNQASLLSHISNTLKQVAEQHSDISKKMVDATTKSNKLLKNSAERLKSVKDSIREDEYQAELQRGNALQKHSTMLAEADKRVYEARKQYAKVGLDETKQQAAYEKAKSAEEVAREAVRHAQEIKNRGAEYQARNKLKSIQDEMARKELEYQKRIKQASTETYQKQADNYAKQSEKIKKLFDEYTKELKKHDEAAAGGPEDYQAYLKRLAQLEAEIIKQVFSQEDLKFGKLLGLDDDMQRFNTQLTSAMKNAKIDWTASVNELRQLLESQEFTINASISSKTDLVETGEKFAGREKGVLETDASYLQKSWEGANEKIKQGQQYTQQVNEATAILDTKLANIDIALENANKAWQTQYKYLQDISKENGSMLGGVKEYVAGLAEGKTNSQALRDMVLKINGGTEKVKQSLTGMNSVLTTFNNRLMQGKTAIAEGKVLSEAWYKAMLGQLEALKQSGQFDEDIIQNFDEALKSMGGAIDAAKDKKEGLEELETLDYEEAVKYIKKFKEHIEKSKGQLKETADTGNQLTTNISKAKEQTNQLIQPTTTVKTILKNQADELQRAQENTLNLKAAEIQYQETLKNRPQQETETGGSSNQATGSIQEQNSQMNSLLQSTKSTNQESGKLAKTAGEVATNLSTSKIQSDGLNQNILSSHASSMILNNSISEVNIKLATAEDTSNQIGAAIEQTTNSVNTASQATAAWNGNLQTCVASGQSAAQSMNQAANAAVEAAQACAQASGACSGGSVQAQRGGRYFAAGGGGRGIDRIPAWLSPGEFVVNARSARNFFPQLQAMNAGQLPIYRDQGGAVTNVGDINITVQGGDTSQQTIREIATGLRREVRRKTSRLF